MLQDGVVLLRHAVGVVRPHLVLAHIAADRARLGLNSQAIGGQSGFGLRHFPGRGDLDAEVV